MNKRVKRFALKFAGVVLGLWLGWQAAGVAMTQLPGPEQEFVQQAATSATLAAAKESAGAEKDVAHAKHDDHDHDKDHTPASTELLKPGEGQTPWFGKVVCWSVTLFLLAAVIGPLAMKLKTPEPPDPADTHDHDDHAHDDHSHGDAHGTGHGHGASPAAAHGGH